MRSAPTFAQKRLLSTIGQNKRVLVKQGSVRTEDEVTYLDPTLLDRTGEGANAGDFDLDDYGLGVDIDQAILTQKLQQSQQLKSQKLRKGNNSLLDSQQPKKAPVVTSLFSILNGGGTKAKKESEQEMYRTMQREREKKQQDRNHDREREQEQEQDRDVRNRNRNSNSKLPLSQNSQSIQQSKDKDKDKDKDKKKRE